MDEPRDREVGGTGLLNLLEQELARLEKASASSADRFDSHGDFHDLSAASCRELSQVINNINASRQAPPFAQNSLKCRLLGFCNIHAKDLHKWHCDRGCALFSQDTNAHLAKYQHCYLGLFDYVADCLARAFVGLITDRTQVQSLLRLLAIYMVLAKEHLKWHLNSFQSSNNEGRTEVGNEKCQQPFGPAPEQNYAPNTSSPSPFHAFRYLLGESGHGITLQQLAATDRVVMTVLESLALAAVTYQSKPNYMKDRRGQTGWGTFSIEYTALGLAISWVGPRSQSLHEADDDYLPTTTGSSTIGSVDDLVTALFALAICDFTVAAAIVNLLHLTPNASRNPSMLWKWLFKFNVPVYLSTSFARLRIRYTGTAESALQRLRAGLQTLNRMSSSYALFTASIQLSVYCVIILCSVVLWLRASLEVTRASVNVYEIYVTSNANLLLKLCAWITCVVLWLSLLVNLVRSQSSGRTLKLQLFKLGYDQAGLWGGSPEPETQDSSGTSSTSTMSSSGASNNELTPDSDDFDDQEGHKSYSSSGALVHPALISQREMLVERVMGEFRTLLDAETYSQNHAGSASTSGASGSNSTSDAGSTDAAGGVPGVGRKKTLSSRKASMDCNDSGDEGGRDHKNNKAPHGSDRASQRKLACPYYRRSPTKHGNPSCTGPGWSSIHRVKEHIYRRHKLPIQCACCGSIFDSETDLNSHYRQLERCQIQVFEAPEGFSSQQEQLLRKRPRQPATEEDKWKGVYQILFPVDEESTIPTPYYDNPSDGNWESRRDSEFERYEQFLNAELPGLVRTQVEQAVLDELGPIESRLVARLPDIIRNCQEQLFHSYKQPKGSPRPIKGDRVDTSAGRSNGLETACNMQSNPSDELAPFFVPPAVADSVNNFTTSLSPTVGGMIQSHADSGYNTNVAEAGFSNDNAFDLALCNDELWGNAGDQLMDEWGGLDFDGAEETDNP